MLLECWVRARERPLLDIRIVCIISRSDPGADANPLNSVETLMNLAGAHLPGGLAKRARNRRQPTSRRRTG